MRVYCFNVFESCVAIGYAGAFFQFIMGRIAIGVLCNFIVRDTFERYYIYRAQQEGIHLNDTHANTKNPIFETVCKYQEKINHH
jgi:hypothetical protein